MRFVAKRESHGFLHRRWHEGDITPDVTEQEWLEHPSMKHFAPHGVEDAQAEPVQEEKITFASLSMQTGLAEMTMAQLREVAAERNVPYTSRTTKAELVELLTT